MKKENIKKFFRLLLCPLLWIGYFIFAIGVWIFPLPIIATAGIIGVFYSIGAFCLNPIMSKNIEPFDGPLGVSDNSFLEGLACLSFPIWMPIYACWYFISKGEFLKDTDQY
jgi:hypothetical protein